MHQTKKSVLMQMILCAHLLTTVKTDNRTTNYRNRRDAEENEHHLLNILKDHEVIPDIIDDATHAELLEVIYDPDLVVNRGDELTPTEVRDPPTKIYWSSEPTSFYTLILVDPDAPSRTRPRNRSFQHWIVSNIPGNDIAAGDTLTEYVGAVPRKGTGLHRYVFLVFEQLSGKREFHETIITNRDATRTKFSVREFMAKYHFKEPLAINFFLAKYDESVPALLGKFLNLQEDDDEFDDDK